jgi:hypothetical protein
MNNPSPRSLNCGRVLAACFIARNLYRQLTFGTSDLMSIYVVSIVPKPCTRLIIFRIISLLWGNISSLSCNKRQGYRSLTVRVYLKYVYYKFTLRTGIVSIATGYNLDDQRVRVRVPVSEIILISPCRPDQLWVPPKLLSKWYRGLFPQGLSGRGVKLTTYLQLVPRSRKCGSTHPLPHTPSWRSA